MASDTISCIVFKTTEAPFINYFKRMLDIGESFEQIERQLPYLKKYYSDMVIRNYNLDEYYLDEPSLEKLFNKWKNHESYD